MNLHEIASAWSVYKYRARSGELSLATLARHGHELIETTPPSDAKSQRYLDLVLSPEVVEIERLIPTTSEVAA